MNNNNYQKQKTRGIKRKYEYILSHGGKCEICGYNKNLSALEFHHKDPNEKEFQIDARRFANTNLDILEQELNKCMILCSNCHREIHNPDLDCNNINNIYDKISVTTFENKSGRICPICGNRFPKAKGKIYCSRKCRDIAEGKDKYPSKEEVKNKYDELKSWQKVADYYNLSRKVIQRIKR
jgi:hypothetical protein